MKGIKIIGVGFNMQNKEVLVVFVLIGVDYNKFISGFVIKWSVFCNCFIVFCFIEGQIEELLDISLKMVIVDVQIVILMFVSFCCFVQNVMVDMLFIFGGLRFVQFIIFLKFVVC